MIEVDSNENLKMLLVHFLHSASWFPSSYDPRIPPYLPGSRHSGHCKAIWPEHPASKLDQFGLAVADTVCVLSQQIGQL